MINEQGMNRTEGQTLCAVDGEQRMTSMEIAELTGKQHKDVLKAIRNMEPAWLKVNGRNFALVEYQDKKGELRPCYLLSKTECLYIATKFNDEARARLVLRWQQLEEDRREALEWERWKARWSQIERPQGQRLLGVSDEEILDEADDIIGDDEPRQRRLLHTDGHRCTIRTGGSRPELVPLRQRRHPLVERPVATHTEVSASGTDGGPQLHLSRSQRSP